MTETDRSTRYQEIADYLRGLVAASSAGTRLPSDAELCQRFAVSRMTARAAVQLLTNEGLLYRRRGQGTFVAPRPVQRLLGSPLSFTESMRRRGMRASSQVLASGPIEPSAEDIEALGLDHDQQPVVLERLRLADGIPMAIERAVLHPSCADLLETDLAVTSLHSAMEAAGRIPTRARAWVTARTASPQERRLLDLSPPGVLLVERRVITDQNQAPLEHTATRYAAERYVFESVLHRDDRDVMA
jgi:GntR family transcriptional regulator